METKVEMCDLGEIKHKGKTLAIIARKNLKVDGVNFFTPEDYPLQLGVSLYKKGGKIRPHLHVPIRRVIGITQEMLHIDKGKVRIIFYSDKKEEVASSILTSGDTVILSGGHGIEVLEDTKIIEVKQGPYMGVEKEKLFWGKDDSSK